MCGTGAGATLAWPGPDPDRGIPQNYTLRLEDQSKIFHDGEMARRRCLSFLPASKLLSVHTSWLSLD